MKVGHRPSPCTWFSSNTSHPPLGVHYGDHGARREKREHRHAPQFTLLKIRKRPSRRDATTQISLSFGIFFFFNLNPDKKKSELEGKLHFL